MLVGERLHVFLGDETAGMKGCFLLISLNLFFFYFESELCPTAIDTETDRVQWAAAGSNVTLYLTRSILFISTWGACYAR